MMYVVTCIALLSFKKDKHVVSNG